MGAVISEKCEPILYLELIGSCFSRFKYAADNPLGLDQGLASVACKQ